MEASRGPVLTSLRFLFDVQYFLECSAVLRYI